MKFFRLLHRKFDNFHPIKCVFMPGLNSHTEGFDIRVLLSHKGMLNEETLHYD